ncbi:MAG: hypothetical protein ACT6FE_02995 [Methanosarcinaceae archaeon]
MTRIDQLKSLPNASSKDQYFRLALYFILSSNPTNGIFMPCESFPPISNPEGDDSMDFHDIPFYGDKNTFGVVQ